MRRVKLQMQISADGFASGPNGEPTARGKGLQIFSEKKELHLVESTTYECGIVVNHYRPAGPNGTVLA
ncbi:MAG TPA: hypothetical protein VJL58_09130 [Pyrinomonadaceae bacterium]|nr:hypothetical protein [Pyrinomonadaceae bacterium]